MKKSELAVTIKKSLSANAININSTTLLVEKQGNIASSIQLAFKDAESRSDIQWAVTEALKDSEPLYVNRKANGPTQKNRRMLSNSYSKVFEGFTLKITGKIDQAAVVETKKPKADPYAKISKAVKTLADVLSATQITTIQALVDEGIQNQINLAHAAKATESARAKKIAVIKTATMIKESYQNFIALGVKPTGEQLLVAVSNRQKAM